MARFLCSVCNVANDPRDYAMRKVGKRWYHLICMERVVIYVLHNYDVKMDDKLRVIEFKEKDHE